MKKVWTVEDGQYSDYHIVGVYSTRVGAEVVAKAIGSGEVIERTCNPGLTEIRAGLSRYRVLIRRDGHVERCEPEDLSGYCIGGSVAIWSRSTAPAYRGTNTSDVLIVETFARDEKQAVKAANEKRAQMIAREPVAGGSGCLEHQRAVDQGEGGGRMKRCSRRGCHNPAYANGLCYHHGGRMPEPLPPVDALCTCVEAAELRKAASNYGRHESDEAADPEDRAGAARDKRLREAAVAYARRAVCRNCGVEETHVEVK